MLRNKRVNLMHEDSDFEEEEMQEMKVCFVGELKHKFIIKVDVEFDEVIEVKSEILERLDLSTPDDGYGTGINSTNPWMKKIKLFSLKGGLELSNKDRLDSIQGQQYLYYSFGEPFDHSVRMEFIEIERKLGEGGFGSVYLGYDKLLGQQVAIKLLNFGSSVKNCNMITKEIDALGQLRHKNIVKLLDYFPLPKKQQLIVVMEYLKGGELDDLWKSQPMRRFSERNAHSLFLQLMNAIDYCHNSKIIHRDMKFQNVMLAEEPKYKPNGKIDISSVNLKVVDFGIFGSISGIRLENVNFGSLRFMAPELLQGDIKSTPKIDIWSLGLMLHAMVFGFLPFNANERNALEHQILNDEIEYTTIKRLKTSSIKNEVRRALNIMLKNTSDDLIDLIEKMLHKDPEQRIDNLSIFEHPWIMKYSYDRFQDDFECSDADENNPEKGSIDTNSDFFPEEKLQETNFDSDPLQLDNKSSKGTSSPTSFKNSEFDKGRGGRTCINQILKNHFMFNIEEHDNETTGNFVKVDLKQRKPPPQVNCVPEEDINTVQKRPSYKKKSSKISVIRHVSLKKSNMAIGEDRERSLKRSNVHLTEDKRQGTANNAQDTGNDFDRNSRNLSSNNRNNEDANNPFGLLQNNSSQDGVNINSVRSKTLKKKRKNKKNHNAVDQDYDNDSHYQHKSTKISKKKDKQNNQFGINESMLDKKLSNNADFGAENCYIIEGPREGVEAQNIRLNIAMEKSSKMQMINRGLTEKSSKPLSKIQHQRIETQNTIDRQRNTQTTKDMLQVPNKLKTNYDKLIEEFSGLGADKKTPNGHSNTSAVLGPLRDGRFKGNFGSNNFQNQNTPHENNHSINMRPKKDIFEADSDRPFQLAAQHSAQQPSTQLPRSRENSHRFKNRSQVLDDESSSHFQGQINQRHSQPQRPIYKLSKLQFQSFKCEKTNANQSAIPLTNHARNEIGNHLITSNKGECSFLPVPTASGIENLLQQSQNSSDRPQYLNNQCIKINDRELIVGPESPIILKKSKINAHSQSTSKQGHQPILQSVEKVNIKSFDDEDKNNSQYFSNQKQQENMNNFGFQNVSKQKTRRDIQFFKIQQQLQGKDDQILSENQSLQGKDEQDGEKNENMRATSAGINHQRLQQLKKSKILSNVHLNAQFPIHSNQAIQMQSHRSNDAIIEFPKSNLRQKEIQSISPQKNSIQLIDQNTEESIDNTSRKNYMTFSNQNPAIQSPPPIIYSEGGPDFNRQLKIIKNMTTGSNVTPFDGTRIPEQLLLSFERQKSSEVKQNHFQNMKKGSRYKQHEKEQFMMSQNERLDFNNDQSSMITPIKKLDGSGQQMLSNKKSSHKNKTKHSKTSDVAGKYLTIESVKTKSMQSGFKNHTQTNFNQGVCHAFNATNYKIQQPENHYNKSGGNHQTMVGQSLGLLNQNEVNSRGTAGNRSKRSNVVNGFSVKGQAIQPMLTNMNLGSILNQTRYTQSDMKRSRNLTQTEECNYEQNVSQREINFPKYQAPSQVNSSANEGLRLPHITTTPTPEKKN